MASDAPQQIAVLQQHIETQETELAALRQRVQTLSLAPPVAGLGSPAVATVTPAPEIRETATAAARKTAGNPSTP